jgi:hypothetical protein
VVRAVVRLFDCLSVSNINMIYGWMMGWLGLLAVVRASGASTSVTQGGEDGGAKGLDK